MPTPPDKRFPQDGRRHPHPAHRPQKGRRRPTGQGLQAGLIGGLVLVVCVIAFFATRGGNAGDVARTPPTTDPSPLAVAERPRVGEGPSRRTDADLEADLLGPRPAVTSPEPPSPGHERAPEPEPPAPEPPRPDPPPAVAPPKSPDDGPETPPDPEPEDVTEPAETEPGKTTGEPKKPETPPPGPPPGFGAGRKWPQPSARHVVSIDHGVAIIPPPDWRSIPPPKEYRGEFVGAEAATRVFSFKDKRDSDPDNYAISLEVWIIPEAKGVDDAFGRWAKGEQYEVGALKLQPMKVGPWEAGRATFATDRSRRRIDADPVPEVAFHKDVTVVFESGRAALIEFNCGVRYGRKKADVFLKSARSFLFLSSETVDKLKAKSGGGTDLPKGWKAFVTKHYEVQYNCDAEFAEEVGKHLELILREYARRFPMPGVLESMQGEGKTRRFTVKVFKTYEEFDTYGRQNGVGGAAAYFSPMQDELVAYRTTEEGKKKTFHIIYHEASHQYMHVYFGYEVDIPIWVDEGVAEYFYGGQLQPNGSFRIEENKERMPVIKEAIRTNTYVPLEKILHYSQAEYYSNAHICYAEGWSLAYFFWQTKDKKYAGRLEKFYESLKASGDKDKAFQDAFGDLDIQVLEEDWKNFVLGL